MSEGCNRQKLDCDANFSQAQEYQDMLEWLEDEYPYVYKPYKIGQVEPNDLLFPGMATEHGSRPPT